MAHVKTRILIISDTHAATPQPSTTTANLLAFRSPLPKADVVLHCGDLTKMSRLSEHEATFSMLRALDAPLKLVIPGNHDGAMDEPYWRDVLERDPEVSAQVRNVVQGARDDGVRLLEEGAHMFDLENGARLKIYASPQTPAFGGWAFQYENGYNFDIPDDVDVVMTHGPPRGMLDYSKMSNEECGCPDLFSSVYKSKPQIHCFGHIHEAWGGYRARWRKTPSTSDLAIQRDTVIDPTHSRTLFNLQELKTDKTKDSVDMVMEKEERMRQMTEQKGVKVDLTEGVNWLRKGEETLFVNAAIMDRWYQPSQFPWIIDLNLPVSG